MKDDTILTIGLVAAGAYVIYKTVQPVTEALYGISGGVTSAAQGVGQTVSSIGSDVSEIGQTVSSGVSRLTSPLGILSTTSDLAIAEIQAKINLLNNQNLEQIRDQEAAAEATRATKTMQAVREAQISSQESILQKQSNLDRDIIFQSTITKGVQAVTTIPNVVFDTVKAAPTVIAKSATSIISYEIAGIKQIGKNINPNNPTYSGYSDTLVKAASTLSKSLYTPPVLDKKPSVPSPSLINPGKVALPPNPVQSVIQNIINSFKKK